MKTWTNPILWTGIFIACVAAIPGAANLGLLILEISPSPRHPPGDVLGEAIGWAASGALVGGVGVVIGEAVIIRGVGGFYRSHKGFILGGTYSVLFAAFLGAALAVLQMNTTDGQAITSTELGAFSGATVGALAGIAGAVGGSILKRFAINLMD